MSGQTFDDAILCSDDEGDFAQDEIDVQQYNSEGIEDEDENTCITISDDDEDDDDEDFQDALTAEESAPKTFEIPSIELDCGEIHPDTVVELRDHSNRKSGHLLSGDFLLVRRILETLKTGEIMFEGYRMRRVEYLAPLFDLKLNDVFMLVIAKESDDRPRFVQGLENIKSWEVVRKRECVFTNKAYNELGLRHVNSHIPRRVWETHNKTEVRKHLFHHGKLVCRWVHVVELDRNGKSYAGEVRRMYMREVDNFSIMSSTLQSKKENSDMPTSTRISTPRTHGRPFEPAQKRRSSIHEISDNQFKRHKTCPQKGHVLTLGDGYCGVGGVSEGARQAGWKIVFGVDNDADAMNAYKLNHPGALHLQMDAHDFPGMVRRCVHGCDHVHMSCPCCFWSVVHTVPGQNDQANLETILTVGPTLHSLKSQTFSLEQAPGLLVLEKHKKYFRILLNGILNQGYGVRWKIQDQAWFGIAQHRRRLIFVGARNGIPLPPFPSPRYGPPGSGLRRFITIEDAMKPLERQWHALHRDPYHQPDREKVTNGERIDPHVNLAKTITCNGGENLHHSGSRALTVRELSSLQGFPLGYKFTGALTTAKKQVGNAWSPASNKHYFELWAAHLEAYNAGLIEAEDEVLDLFSFLENKGFQIPKPELIDVDLFYGSSADQSSHHHRDRSNSLVCNLEYRYLHKIERTIKPLIPLRLWGKRTEIDRKPSRRRRRSRVFNRTADNAANDDDNNAPFDLFNHTSDIIIVRNPTRATHYSRPRPRSRPTYKEDNQGNIIILDDDDDDDDEYDHDTN